jgi:hypothetical protein
MKELLIYLVVFLAGLSFGLMGAAFFFIAEPSTEMDNADLLDRMLDEPIGGFDKRV